MAGRQVSPVLAAEAVTKQFAKDDAAIVALREFTVSIEEGTFVTVLGRSVSDRLASATPSSLFDPEVVATRPNASAQASRSPTCRASRRAHRA